MLLWTPPHFWALSLLLARNYAAADVPMMPVVRGAAATARQMLVYSIVLLAVTLVPGVIGTFGVVYLAAAAVLGAALCVLALRLRRATGPANAARACSTSRCCTWRCCSWPSRSTRPCAELLPSGRERISEFSRPS